MERNIDLEHLFDETRLSYPNLPRWVREDGRIAVLAVDPGVTTGLSLLIARYDESSRTFVVDGWGSHQVSYGGSGNRSDRRGVSLEHPEQDVADRIAELFLDLAELMPTALVIEDFIIRKMNTTREFLAPVRVTAGIVQEIYHEAPSLVGKIAYQTPADAKSVCTDERMDRWGYQIETQKDRHSRDADRHGILFLRRLSEDPRRTASLSSPLAR